MSFVFATSAWTEANIDELFEWLALIERWLFVFLCFALVQQGMHIFRSLKPRKRFM